MEKFGIFQLLDALSAMTSVKNAEETAAPPPSTDQPSPAIAPPTADPARSNADAFALLIARQEAISKRIDGGKK